MEPSRKLFPLAFLLLLLVATEMAPVVVQARECEMQSNAFRGMCMWDANCASVCRTEGFPSGRCSGFRRRCFCTKQCT